MKKSPKDIVKEGYDKVSYAYREDRPDESGDTYLRYKEWIDTLAGLASRGGYVLDLGCGCGVPSSLLLAGQGYQVLGIDLSPVQIERAKELVPQGTFLCEDMCKVSFEDNLFDVVVSFYALIHIPLEEQPALLTSVFKWLKPGGYFLFTAGHTAWTGEEQDWLHVEGAHMYWSHTDRSTYLSWLTDTGFTVLWDRFIPEGKGGHTLILARNEVSA
ncbi:class I SAM-dependent methyltransferase [Telluribacter humicola]|uniref:class I SAM-dependent methyltransferase n=1 Tax=Telluribacter humicola TaxID=1720261 RepID=UPI001A961D35|nr:class I SAM-dependent methyltransferase [Telluribacter humicola]